MLGAVVNLPTELLACPACRGRLEARPGGVACLSCERIYTVFDGASNLLLNPPNGEELPPGLTGRAAAAITAVPLVFDLVQRLFGTAESERRLRRALAGAHGVVLDAGGGTGALESMLPPSAAYLWLDPDRRKLRRFRAKSQATAVLGDATNLPLRTASVDWAVSVAVSHHLDDDALGRALDELRRVVRERVVFLDAVVSPRRTSRLLWRYDRGRHPRPAELLKRELAARFRLETVEEYTGFHRYLLVTAVPPGSGEG
jgi:SAM-dependent methyltransferase